MGSSQAGYSVGGLPSLHHSTISLPELSKAVSDLVLELPKLVFLGDANIHAEAPEEGATQDFMMSMTTMDLSLAVYGPTH